MRSLLSLCLLFLALSQSQAQDRLPSIQLKDLSGNLVQAENISNDGKPIIISFWATWCKPCIRELSAIQDEYVDWQDETGVKLVAISIDDSRNTARVKPFVAGQGWDFEIYLDENQELKRSLNVNNIPHTFLLDGSGSVVWQHSGYIPGDEEHLYETVQALLRGEKLEE